jgi:hypothetical protein
MNLIGIVSFASSPPRFALSLYPAATTDLSGLKDENSTIS